MVINVKIVVKCHYSLKMIKIASIFNLYVDLKLLVLCWVKLVLVKMQPLPCPNFVRKFIASKWVSEALKLLLLVLLQFWTCIVDYVFSTSKPKAQLISGSNYLMFGLKTRIKTYQFGNRVGSIQKVFFPSFGAAEGVLFETVSGSSTQKRFSILEDQIIFQNFRIWKTTLLISSRMLYSHLHPLSPPKKGNVNPLCSFPESRNVSFVPAFVILHRFIRMNFQNL